MEISNLINHFYGVTLTNYGTNLTTLFHAIEVAKVLGINNINQLASKLAVYEFTRIWRNPAGRMIASQLLTEPGMLKLLLVSNAPRVQVINRALKLNNNICPSLAELEFITNIKRVFPCENIKIHKTPTYTGLYFASHHLIVELEKSSPEDNIEYLKHCKIVRAGEMFDTIGKIHAVITEPVYIA